MYTNYDKTVGTANLLTVKNALKFKNWIDVLEGSKVTKISCNWETVAHDRGYTLNAERRKRTQLPHYLYTLKQWPLV